MFGTNVDSSLNIFDQFQVMVRVLKSPVFWVLILLTVVTCLITIIWYKGFRRMVSPTKYQRIQEVQISSYTSEQGTCSPGHGCELFVLVLPPLLILVCLRA